MIVRDRLYGKIKIERGVVYDLIKSKSLQRLKKIDQAGYYFPYVKHKALKRFEHSVGCYYLLKKFNASPEEQIFGLIHDVSHTAFSHCIDYVFNYDGTEDYHDKTFKDFILKKTDIPEILKKHNLDVSYIIEEKNFPLQEKLLPDLCADRLDYSLRTFIMYGIAPRKEVLEILEALRAEKGKWFFEDIKIARKYARYFFLLNKRHYCEIRSVTMLKRVSDYLKYALQKGYIDKEYLYTDDESVIKKVNKNLRKDKKLAALWEKMNNGRVLRQASKNYDAEIFCKSRVVDPLVKRNGRLVKLSSLDKRWKLRFKKESKSKLYWVKV